jgi:hypothetical protein
LDFECWILDGLQKCEMRNAECGMRQWRSSYALRGYGGIREGKFWILNFGCWIGTDGEFWILDFGWWIGTDVGF